MSTNKTSGESDRLRSKASDLGLPDVHSTAAGGVVFRIVNERKVEVLLIYRNGFWDLPKGKRDPGESIPACAAREVAEEVDCEMPMLLNFLVRTQHQYVQAGEHIDKTTWWYAMVIKPGNLHPQREEGIEAVEWVGVEEARKRVGFDNLKQALDAFTSWLTTFQSSNA